MIHLRDTLAQTLAGLPPLEGAFSPAVGFGASGVALDAIPAPMLDRFLTDAAVDVAGADAKLQAAYLMGNVAFCVAEPLVGLALRDQWLCGAAPAGVSLTPRHVPWDEDGETGVDQVFDIGLDPAVLQFATVEDPARLAVAVETLFTPLCAALHAATGLSRPALFMLVSDSFAYAFLAHGRRLGQEEAAMALAMQAFGTRGTRLYSKKLRFDYITLPEAPDIGDWLRVRGGCCRAYTRPGKPAYCTTCVLRDDDSRTARYRNYLRRTRLPHAIPDTKDT